MKKVLTTSLVASVILLSGCATPKVLQATGGSKSDGIVNLSYEYGMFEQPVIDYSMAEQTAAQRCKAWGYKHAEAFGGGQQTCQAVNGYGNCVRYLVTVAYQCTG